MGKTTKTVYTCDRCGAEIADAATMIGRIRYIHIIKWFVPTGHYYKEKYLCDECYESFKKWLKQRVHKGRWEKVLKKEIGEWYARCSECGYTEMVFAKGHVCKNWNYCPVCGARMEETDAD